MMGSKPTFALTMAVSACATMAGAASVTVEPTVSVGLIKAVNGVGQPPMIGQLAGWKMMHYLKDAGIPYSRLHDVGGWLGKGLYVDIPNLFPDFDADENDPENYRFAYTDDLMSALIANGVEPFFRLGITIENFVASGFPPVHAVPPKDPAKWARICEHVISHYLDGWANGFHHKITYWEIWNEPDNSTDAARNPMFCGSFELYVNLYGVTATHLKRRFGNRIKVGGYGSCGYYAAVGSDHVEAANSSPRMKYFVECSHKFMGAVRDNGWPLDFFSFHSYSEPKEVARQVIFADEHLSEYGFTRDRTERVFNEWLPYVKHENLGTALQATGIAAELIQLQNGPCDLACIYDARCDVGSYSPLFNPLTFKPHKAYYAFVFFNELRKLGTAVRCATSEGLVACAAAKDGEVAVLVANDSDKSCSFSVTTGRITECRLIDDVHTNEIVPCPKELPPHSTLLVRAVVGQQE